MSTVNTCGSCLAGFTASKSQGDGNTKCKNTSSLANRRLQSSSETETEKGIDKGGSCGSDDDCAGFESCVDSFCAPPPPVECINDCSGHGACSFRNTNTGQAVDDCREGDTDCAAVCACNGGYETSSCFYTTAEL